MEKICFVCSGNTCRSPMAQYIFNSKTKYQKKYVAVSAGIYAKQGDSIAQNSKQALAQNGITVSEFLSTQADEKLNECSLILTMDKHHEKFLKAEMPEISRKTFTLKEFLNPKEKNFNIKDPFGGDFGVYVDCYNEIEKCVIELIEKLEA